MTSSKDHSSSPPSYKRARSYSDDDDDEDEVKDFFEDDQDHPRRRSRRCITSSSLGSGDSQAIYAPHWSSDDLNWIGSKFEDDLALLEAIEDQAATYSPSAPVNITSNLFSSLLISHSKPSLDQLGPHVPSTKRSSKPMGLIPDPITVPSNCTFPPPASSNEKPFKCSLCPKSFTRNYDLTRHLSSHQDQRPHVCEHCKRSFNRRDALSRHNVIRGCGRNEEIGANPKN